MTYLISHSEEIILTPKPYVYKGTLNISNQIYYGFRKANVACGRTALEDFGTYYKTSSDEVKKIGFENFSWELIDVYDTWEEAYDAEQLLIYNDRNNPLILNKHYIDPFSGHKRFVNETEDNRHHCWIHDSGEEIYCTKYELHELYGLSLPRLDDVISGMQFKHYKWHIKGRMRTTAPRARYGKDNPLYGRCGKDSPSYGIKCPAHSARMTGCKNPRYNNKKYNWIHTDGTKEYCTKYDLKIKYDLSQSHLCMVIHGKCKSCHGWSIASD